MLSRAPQSYGALKSEPELRSFPSLPNHFSMTLNALLSGLPPEISDDLTPEIHNLLIESKKTIVVLDDESSGTQTLFDVPVITDLSPVTIREAIDAALPVLFLLTNSRSLNEEQTTELHQNLGEILKEFQEDVIIISRSDSSLRGHFPQETNTLRKTLEIPEAPILFIPFCAASGCLTLNDTHYIVEGDHATPIHLTRFAKDNAFPFSHSYLPDYLAEKSQDPLDIQSLSLRDLRSGNVTSKLDELPDGSTCIVNATSLKDLNVLSLALLKSNRRFIIRSAASFVQSLAGIPSRPPLEPWQLQDLETNPNGGLIIIGSDTPKANDQLNHLLKNTSALTAIKLSAPDIIHSTFNLKSTISDVQTAMVSGQNVVLFTSLRGLDEEDDLTITQSISKALIKIVQGIKERPSFLVAEGAITSFVIATDALGVQQAQVLGQVIPGVPVWAIGNETLHPGLAYVVFPNNIGGAEALTLVVEKFGASI